MDDPAAAAPAAAPPAPPVELPSTDEAAIIHTVTADAPTPSAAAPVDAKPVEARFAGLLDRKGNAFDPALHLVNADGTPKLTPRGLLWGKPGLPLGAQATEDATKAPRPARSLDVAAAAGNAAPEAVAGDERAAPAPAGNVQAPPPAPAPVQAPAALSEEERRKLALQTAEVTVQIIQALGKFVAGKDGAFKKDDENGDEYRDLKASYVAWYETMENLVHVSPGWIVAVNTGRYMSRCASTETGQRRIEKGSKWATSTWSKMRLMFHTWSATRKANP